MSMIKPNLTDVDQFKLMMDHKRSVVKVALFIGMPLFPAMAIKNFITGDNFLAFSTCMMFLILILLGFVIMRRIDEKSEYKIYSILFRLFIAVMGVSLFYDIGFQSNFSRIEWCYIYPILVFFAVSVKEGTIWVSIFYGILAFLILNFDVQGITLFQIQELRSRFLVSFFAVCMLSLFLEQGFRRAQQRLLHHQSILKESENRYRQAYEKLNIEMQERKQAEEALRESQDRNRDLVEYSQYLICTHDLKGQILSVNQEGARLLGYDQRELLNKNVRDFLVHDVRDEFDTYLDTIHKHGTAEGLMLLQTAAGEKRIWEYNNTLRTEGVTSPIVRAMAHDVTERIHADKAVKRLAQENAIVAKIGQIISSTLNVNEVYDQFCEEVRKVIPFDRIAITMIDHEKGMLHNEYILSNNDVPDRALGHVIPLAGSLTEEVMHKRSVQLIHIEERDELAVRFPGLLPLFDAGYRSFLAAPLISKDQVIGTLHIFSVKSKTYTEADKNLAESIGNQIAGAIANVRLFTERKHAEEALKEKTEELARSNRDLEQFAYVASHDLQEPLRMVTSYVQLLAKRYKGKLDSDADEFIGFAEDGAIRMCKLINDLLTYSLVGTRGKELEPTDCKTVLDQSLNNLKVAIEENGAVVTHDPLPTVMADRPQLGQLFQNLIGNAIKFRSNEPPRVHVSASRNGNGWIFSVRDNGIGITAEYSKSIFIIFQRLHSRQEYAGTGIGLAICKKIVERHGGHIWVESEVGKGATFYFTLPASKTQLPSS
jgi:PAS domain S-box-containing protein